MGTEFLCATPTIQNRFTLKFGVSATLQDQMREWQRISGPRKVTHIALQSITFRTSDQAKTWEKLEARSPTLLPEGLYC